MNEQDMVEFWRRVDKSGECWTWMGTMASSGYGKFCYLGKYRAAHRFSWEMVNGPIPYAKLILHKCDNPKCVNPDHLSLGTTADNNRDKEAKGRSNHPIGINHGRAKLTDELVSEARQLFRMGHRLTHLSRKYRIDPATMADALVGKTWAHVNDPCMDSSGVKSVLAGLAC